MSIPQELEYIGEDVIVQGAEIGAGEMVRPPLRTDYSRTLRKDAHLRDSPTGVSDRVFCMLERLIVGGTVSFDSGRTCTLFNRESEC